MLESVSLQKSRLRSAKNVIFPLLCILVDRPMGGFEQPKPPLLTPLERLDIVWDRYIADSLKSETRSKRGKEIRRRVEPRSAAPGNWQEFRRIDDNKTELFFPGF